MKTNLLKRLVAIGLTCGSIMTLSPIVANAEWKEENGKEYFLDENGDKVTGWLYDNEAWYYMDADGVMEKNTAIIEKDTSGNEHKYILGADGALIDNDNNSMENPELAIEWVMEEDGNWYAIRNGIKLTGLQKECNGNLYYMDKDGVMQVNTVVNIEGAIYKINETGICTRIN